MLEETFNLDEGPVTLTFPAALSEDSYSDLEAQFELFLRRAKRRALKARDEAANWGGPTEREPFSFRDARSPGTRKYINHGSTSLSARSRPSGMPLCIARTAVMVRCTILLLPFVYFEHRPTEAAYLHWVSI
jgi:hypothetical protein